MTEIQAPEQQSTAAGDTLTAEVLDYLVTKTKHTFPADHDIFASGIVTSMFAMELVVYLEKTYEVSILGPDLKLDNFRSAQRIAALLTRLRDAE